MLAALGGEQACQLALQPSQQGLRRRRPALRRGGGLVPPVCWLVVVQGSRGGSKLLGGDHRWGGRLGLLGRRRRSEAPARKGRKGRRGESRPLPAETALPQRPSNGAATALMRGRRRQQALPAARGAGLVAGSRCGCFGALGGGGGGLPGPSAAIPGGDPGAGHRRGAGCGRRWARPVAARSLWVGSGEAGKSGGVAAAPSLFKSRFKSEGPAGSSPAVGSRQRGAEPRWVQVTSNPISPVGMTDQKHAGSGASANSDGLRIQESTSVMYTQGGAGALGGAHHRGGVAQQRRARQEGASGPVGGQHLVQLGVEQAVGGARLELCGRDLALRGRARQRRRHLLREGARVGGQVDGRHACGQQRAGDGGRWWGCMQHQARHPRCSAPADAAPSSGPGPAGRRAPPAHPRRGAPPSTSRSRRCSCCCPPPRTGCCRRRRCRCPRPVRGVHGVGGGVPAASRRQRRPASCAAPRSFAGSAPRPQLLLQLQPAGLPCPRTGAKMSMQAPELLQRYMSSASPALRARGGRGTAAESRASLPAAPTPARCLPPLAGSAHRLLPAPPRPLPHPPARVPLYLVARLLAATVMTSGTSAGAT